MKRLSLKAIQAFVAVLLVALLATGCGGGNEDPAASQADNEKLKVGFVYIGPVNDAGWTQAHDEARKYLMAELPYVDASDYVENVPENPTEAERVITQLVEQGNKIIFTTSFGYMDPTIKVAQKYPDVTFLHCSGYQTAPNVGAYFGRMYQARYLSGLVAGKATKTNLIGYVAAMPIPEVIRGINAFTLGVQKVNPDAQVKVVWTNTWVDAAIEKDAAIALLDAGADVIAQHQDSASPQQAAEEAGKFGIGYNSDMSKMAPKATMTSPVWNWGPYYVDTVKAIKEGTWQSTLTAGSLTYWGGLKEGTVDLAPFGPMVSEEVKQLVEQERERIVSGEWDVFTGPIKDQSGAVKVAEGQVMTDDEILNMNWFVQGVVGSVE
ncbi:BMP family ABC transporter substrate-binding protein [Desulfallas thermosapovorans]|uniref:Nucleoside-binding protein n=1 Tax=Desulfallas thermosapovorans DSM 6562 TaxID=1121431 RepID=A0A5S4ZQT3_9FIRM|nr:BMP family ABC transporter substrate-binding protein [Desulfallas thermosapovorans]TYO94976.1 nucleoside-binding protein [Desulfallas thermosapovorans DSM 6562]